jgi:hypothetical protein
LLNGKTVGQIVAFFIVLGGKMAIYVIDRKNVADMKGNRGKDTVSFAYDDIDDVQSLPGLDKINGGSAAIHISTKKIIILGKDGWI